MEDMAREFGGMLKETLDKMRERIELLSSTNLDVDVVPGWRAAVEARGVRDGGFLVFAGGRGVARVLAGVVARSSGAS